MTTSFKLFAASSRIMAVDNDGAKTKIGAEKYPWRTLEVGQAFAVDTKLTPVKLQTLQSAASRWSKKLGKQFRVMAWENEIIEVARLPDAVEQPKEELTKPDEVAGVDINDMKFW